MSCVAVCTPLDVCMATGQLLTQCAYVLSLMVLCFCSMTFHPARDVEHRQSLNPQ